MLFCTIIFSPVLTTDIVWLFSVSLIFVARTTSSSPITVLTSSPEPVSSYELILITSVLFSTKVSKTGADSFEEKVSPSVIPSLLTLEVSSARTVTLGTIIVPNKIRVAKQINFFIINIFFYQSYIYNKYISSLYHIHLLKISFFSFFSNLKLIILSPKTNNCYLISIIFYRIFRTKKL